MATSAADAVTEADVLVALRAEATLRDELVARGWATHAKMDELGYPSHERLSELQEAGQLQPYLTEQLEEFGSIVPSHHLSGDQFNQIIRRGYHGKFAPGEGQHQAAHHRGLGAHMRDADPGSSREHLAPLAFNAVRTSNVVDQLGSAPNTRVKRTRLIGGQRIYTTEAHRLHQQIVEKLLATATPNERDETTGEWKRTPEALYLAGGPASGKSSALDEYDKKPEGAATLELDAVKAELPEFRALRDAGDPYASDAVHREAADILQQAQAAAERRGLSVIVDGVGDSGKGQFAGRLLASKAAGYKVHVLYADAPTKVAEQRATERAAKTNRVVPLEGLRAMHANVARAFNEDVLPIASQLDSLDMYDTRGNKFKGEPAVRHAHLEGGEVKVDNPELHEQFKAKAGENTGEAVRDPSYI